MLKVRGAAPWQGGHSHSAQLVAAAMPASCPALTCSFLAFLALKALAACLCLTRVLRSAR